VAIPAWRSRSSAAASRRLADARLGALSARGRMGSRDPLFAHQAGIARQHLEWCRGQGAGALARRLGPLRAPTGKTVFDRPLRYVPEVAGSNYRGDTGDALGFDRLLSLGVGIEFDTSKYDMIVAHPLGPAPAHRPRRRRPVARHCRELLSMRACSLTPQHGQLTNRPGQAAAAHADEGTDKAVGYWACHRGLVAR
jgi:hypothetical protein